MVGVIVAEVIRPVHHHSWWAAWAPVWITLILAAVLIAALGLLFRRR